MKLGEYTLEIGPPTFRSKFPDGELEKAMGQLRENGVKGPIEMFLAHGGQVYFLQTKDTDGQHILACSLPTE